VGLVLVTWDPDDMDLARLPGARPQLRPTASRGIRREHGDDHMVAVGRLRTGVLTRRAVPVGQASQGQARRGRGAPAVPGDPPLTKAAVDGRVTGPRRVIQAVR